MVLTLVPLTAESDILLTQLLKPLKVWHYIILLLLPELAFKRLNWLIELENVLIPLHSFNGMVAPHL